MQNKITFPELMTLLADCVYMLDDRPDDADDDLCALHVMHEAEGALMVEWGDDSDETHGALAKMGPVIEAMIAARWLVRALSGAAQ